MRGRFRGLWGCETWTCPQCMLSDVVAAARLKPVCRTGLASSCAPV
jgi:hypothetical protein